MNINSPRYLTSFNIRELPHRFTDILIIGSGLAGLRAALAVSKEQSVTVLTKAEEIEVSNSDRAQGGIASVLDPTDAFSKHIADTLVAGADLCDEEVVTRVVTEGPERIQEMIQMGTQFDLQKDGTLELGREGGHGMNRVAHAHGDATGHELMRTLVENVKKAPNIQVHTQCYTLDLLTFEGRCVGAIVNDSVIGQVIYWARQTIVATGGIGQLYRETTNSPIATGDGIAMALRAGAKIKDMEFVQFHPTVLYVAGSSRSLITEAIRGEGAFLIDKNGHRFMPEYDDRAELAPRDIVSRSIVAQMVKTNSTTVFLTLAHKDPELILHRFPGIAAICAHFGIDITKDPIPVRPGAHYMMGGIEVDLEGRTNIPGLWAIGEVSCTGLHGANRLASNSLLEAIVYGVAAGIGASKAAETISDEQHLRVLPISNQIKTPRNPVLHLQDIKNTLKSVMWRSAGVKRNAELLAEGLESLAQLKRFMQGEQIESEGWDLQNMLQIGTIIMQAALLREETRGGHTRTEFPERLPEWRKHLTFQRQEDGSVTVETENLK
ncbi:MAG: L-aspartate oxidase [Thermoguttaceae bacterium]|nr:L-aspartate oxidase [Thermoguttaceae bacterium]